MIRLPALGWMWWITIICGSFGAILLVSAVVDWLHGGELVLDSIIGGLVLLALGVIAFRHPDRKLRK